MGIAGMVLGIIAIVFVFIPFFGLFVAFPCAVVGLPLSWVALHQGRKLGSGVGMAIAGMATTTLALLLAILWTVLIATAFATAATAA